MKEVHAPHLGRSVKLGGRKRPVARGPRLSLKNYLRASLPQVPESCDYSAKAAAILADVMLNDQLGCCVVSGAYHVLGLETANAGDPFHATPEQIVADYSAIGGYRPGDPSSDQGCDEQVALAYWTQHGFADGSKLMGWLAIDATDAAEVRAAMFLFENVYFGCELADAWISPFPAGDGFTWDAAGPPDPNNGHCFVGTGYDARGVQIDTWGLKGTVTWAAVSEYASKAGQGELYVLLSDRMLAKGQSKAPNGVDWTSLLADWDTLGGHVPLVPPAPTPAPAPAGPVTLEQAQQWAAEGLSSVWQVCTRGQAAAAVDAALAKNWPTP